MKLELLIAWLMVAVVSTTIGEPAMPSLYDIPVTRITGEAASLRAYEGKVLLIVNTASKCGFTVQYAGLQSLFEQYRDDGLVILGFPANDFGNQEPGSDDVILTFCQKKYGVSFPMFSKVTVKEGSDQHPLFRYLTEAETNPDHAGRITWNFNKFLIARDGRVITRFGSRVKPDAAELIAAIETALVP